MNKFSSRIKDIEARMNRLKTFGLSSSSSLSMISKTVVIPMKIVPYKINYEWDRCAGEYSYRITINWANRPGLCSAYIKAPKDLRNRRYAFDRLSNSNNMCEFGLEIISGSDDDLDIFNSGGSIAPFNITIEIVASANFTISYTSRREH